MSGVQKTNQYRGYQTICPILANTPFGEFLLYKMSYGVYFPKNVTGSTLGCQPTVNTFVSLPDNSPIPSCCSLDNISSTSININM